MAQTISFTDFDDATHNYLLEVREREGRGAPGVFAPVSNSLAGCGCIMGPIIIIATLCITMLSGVIYKTPTRIAMLQTAGLLMGGWMLVAAFRVWGSKNSPKRAGTWVYGDPLFLYEATGDEVKVTAVDEVLEAQFTHNYNNGAYQNSVVKLLMPGNRIVAAQVNSEQRAEQMVVFYNYLAWARGSEGGDRAELDPAVLGGLAKYVAKNDNEPLDGTGNINLNLIELDIGEIPVDPRREGGGVPNPLPYLLILAAGVGIFFGSQVVMTPYRDGELYKAVTKEPVEPRFLRMYLADKWATRHKDDIFKRLAPFYTRKVIPHVEQVARDAALSAGMTEVLKELSKSDQPVVSIRVKEAASPQGGEGEAAERAKKVRETIADKTMTEFGRLEPPVSPPAGMTFNVTPPHIGYQLIGFVEAPDDANPHFDIEYRFVPAEGMGQYRVVYTVTIRTRIETDPVVNPKQFALTQTYSAASASEAATAIGNEVFKDMIGEGDTPRLGAGGGN